MTRSGWREWSGERRNGSRRGDSRRGSPDGGSGELADGGRDGRLRVKACDESLELALALPGGLGEQLGVVLLSEVRGEHPQPGKVDPTGADPLEDGGEPANQAGGVEAIEGDAFGHPQLLDAEVEHVGEAPLEVEPTSVHLLEVSEEVGLDLVGAANERAGGLEEVRVAERNQRGMIGHPLWYHGV